MNKDKYLGFRKLENEMSNNYKIINELEDFLKKNQDYLDNFKGEKVAYAIKQINRYIDLLRNKSLLLDKQADVLINEFQKNCLHEIVLHDDREKSLVWAGHEYYCPLCRRTLKDEEVSLDSLIIDVDAIYNCESPSQCDIVYKAIDHIIINDLDYTEEEFIKALDLSVPKNIFTKSIKDGYRARRRV